MKNKATQTNNFNMNIRSISFDAVDKNIDERTIDFCASTGFKVTRYSWFDDPVYEELDINDTSVDLTRFNNGAPLLRDHNTYSINNILGVIEKSWVRDGKLFVRARFSKRDDVEVIYQDVLDKILRNVSIGYLINSFTRYKGENDKYETIKATNFTPYEVSIVTVPADPDAGIRSIDSDFIPRCISEERERMKLNLMGLRSTKVLSSEPDTSANQNIQDNSNSPKDNTQNIQVNEQERILKIMELCGQRNIKNEDMQKIIKETKTFDDAKVRIADIVFENTKELNTQRKIDNQYNEFEDNNKNSRHAPVTSTGHDEKKLIRDGIENALQFRTKTEKEINDNGKRFINLSLLEMCRKMIPNSDYLNNGDLYKRVITTTDLPNILMNITDKAVRKKYNDMQQTFRPLVGERKVSNLKIQTELQTGTFQALPDMTENEQYQEVTFSESKETYRVTKHGVVASVTEEMIINDDLSIIDRFPAMFARAAAEKENILVWNQLTNLGLLMSDNRPLFHKDHNNISPNPKLIDDSSITEALVGIKGQKGLDGEELFYNSDNVKYLVTTTVNQARANRLLAQITATKSEDVNTYAGKFQLIIEDKISVLGKNAYIFACDPAVIDGIVLAYLKGEEGVQVKRYEEWQTNKISFACKLFAASKAIEYRSFYLNTGGN